MAFLGRSWLYHIDGNTSKIFETEEEYNEAAKTGEWFDSPVKAAEALEASTKPEVKAKPRKAKSGRADDPRSAAD